MLKFLVIVLVIILVIRFLNRLSFSSYVYSNDRRKQEPGHQQKEGSVTVERNNNTEKRIRKDDGEYVDYEEIK